MPRILTDIYHKAANRSVFNQHFTSKKRAVTLEFALLFIGARFYYALSLKRLTFVRQLIKRRPLAL